MKSFLIALQFLTILPVKIGGRIKKKDFGRSLLYFPVVGMLIGLVLSLAIFLFGFLPDLVMSAVILIVSSVITGGIHLDGFADTCDGFYGKKPREEILRIMRDSRTGVMGVIGVTCLLILKFSLIASTPRDILWRSLIMMTVFGRWSQVLACHVSTYAREEGKAKYFIEYAGKKEVFTGTLIALGLFLLLMQMNSLILFLVSAFLIFLSINYIKRRIGGMTGDTIGAVSEIAEVSVLLFCFCLSMPGI